MFDVHFFLLLFFVLLRALRAFVVKITLIPWFALESP